MDLNISDPVLNLFNSYFFVWNLISQNLTGSSRCYTEPTAFFIFINDTYYTYLVPGKIELPEIIDTGIIGSYSLLELTYI